MTRLSEKLHLLHIIIKISQFSLSTLNLLKALTFKTLTFIPSSIMGEDFFSFHNSNTDDSSIFDLDYDNTRSSAAAASSSASGFFSSTLYRGWFSNDDDDNDFDKLYLVPYRWWSEVETVGEQVGVLYNVISNFGGDDAEIVLDFRKEEGSERSEDTEEGFSGREYAIISGRMWLQALKRHNDSKGVMKVVSGSFIAEDYSQDVFPLQIRLSVSRETNSLVVKISSKDNLVSSYRRACNIFAPKSKLLHIWDFSGQTTQFLIDDKINLPNDTLGEQGKEITLELQAYGFSDSMTVRDENFDEMVEMETSFESGSVKMNGCTDHVRSYSSLRNSQSGSGFRVFGYLGLRGLQNLGNTCFMNSAIQCLAHTPKLVDYFLGDYGKEINQENLLGTKGELALAFGDLLSKLWTPRDTPVAPAIFKRKLADFAPQFSGYNQHDSQEFLSFLLDGLHEDLNRVKSKPYIAIKDAEGRLDEVVAEEYWRNHLARNDSIIVDLCQGQYQSTLVCPACNKKSVTFDPFMYLSLPLPSTTMRTMTLTVLSTDGMNLPTPITVTVPKCGRQKDLIEALSIACSLRNDEMLMVVEIYKNRIFRRLTEPSDSVALIRDEDKLVAYRLLKDNRNSPMVVFMHERVERPCEFERAIPNLKLFGIPFVARLENLYTGFDLHKQYLKLLSPLLMPADDALNDYDDVGITTNEDSTMEDVVCPTISDSNTGSDTGTEDDQCSSSDFQFYLKDGMRSTEIKMNEPLPVPKFSDNLEVYVTWSESMIEKYDTCLLSSLPEVLKPQLYARRPQESVSLYKCLEAFLKEEPLGPEDMWDCPSCKKPRQARKKLDLWRLPEILVVHLKRFSYSRYIRNKLETYVDFPIDDFDLSTYTSKKDSQFSNHYVLYAISNHHGGMGCGHYDAFIDLGYRKWYEFDDSRVSPVSEDDIKTSAAYVLFYRRVA
uniref:Ubiquitin carboxyl-terminal hydrolase n=1 Tax=Populus trichocarpa TaxID=3694 RepID=A0A2K2A548_POPTR|eukprot:XP_024459304.1 ubiquitin carboxyl-terminal hydrolase 8 [Populus trichocarpa]